MTEVTPSQRIEMIPIDRITVINPRSRNKHAFKTIIDNIGEIGLKRPITVTRRSESGGPFYDLICGQGRLEAFRELGQAEVPALVVPAELEDCLIASLVENCARRSRPAVELLQDIGGMKERGQSEADIARRTGLSIEYIRGVLRLLGRGERRLLGAVESGYLPLSVAIKICDSNDDDVQSALQDAYENKVLRGRNLLAARRLVQSRKKYGKGQPEEPRTRTKLSSANLLRAFEQDSARKQMMIRRSQATRSRLLFIVEALRQLVSDETLLALMEDEGLTSMPARLAARISYVGSAP